MPTKTVPTRLKIMTTSIVIIAGTPKWAMAFDAGAYSYD
jgi:hypothetical protein